MDYVLIYNKNIIFACHKLFNKISDASKAYRMDKESILRIQCATFLLYTLNWSQIFIKLDTSHLVKQLHTPRFRKVVSTQVHCGFNTLFIIHTNNSKLCKNFRSLVFLEKEPTITTPSALVPNRPSVHGQNIECVYSSLSRFFLILLQMFSSTVKYVSQRKQRLSESRCHCLAHSPLGKKW